MEKLNTNDLEKVSGGTKKGTFRFVVAYWNKNGDEETFISKEYTDEGECERAMCAKQIELEEVYQYWLIGSYIEDL